MNVNAKRAMKDSDVKMKLMNVSQSRASMELVQIY